MQGVLQGLLDTGFIFTAYLRERWLENFTVQSNTENCREKKTADLSSHPLLVVS